MKRFCILAGLGFAAATAFAQSGGDPLSSGTKMIFNMEKTNILKSAEEMPEDGYSFKPTPQVRSFGQLLAHVADGQYEFCGPVVGDGKKGPDVEKNVTSKADIVKALKEAFAYCDKAYQDTTDAKASELVPFFGGRKMARLNILQFNNVHTSEHYGNAVTYLRLKNLVPPSSQGH